MKHRWMASYYLLLAGSMIRRAAAFQNGFRRAFGTTTTLLMLLGSGIGGVLTDQLGVIPLMSGAAIIYVMAGALAAVLLLKPTRKTVATV